MDRLVCPLAVSLALCGCSMTFGADPPPWPLGATAGDLRMLQRVTSRYYYDFPAVVLGVDGAWWFAHPTEGLTSLHLVRLAEPPLEESLPIGTVKIAAPPGRAHPRVQFAGRSAV